MSNDDLIDDLPEMDSEIPSTDSVDDLPMESVPEPEQNVAAELPEIPVRAKQYFQQTMDVEAKNPTTRGYAMDPLYILNGDSITYNTLTDRRPNLNTYENHGATSWVTAISEGRKNLVRGGVFTSSLENEDSDWRQGIPGEQGVIYSRRPRLQDPAGGVLTGEHAAMRMSAVMGLGATISTPAYASGFWSSFKAPSAEGLLELDRRIAHMKVAVGRATNGMAFSNTSVYTSVAVINFAIQHIYEANIQNFNPDTIKRNLLVTDLNAWLIAFANTMYPNGHPYSRPCMSPDNSCTHVETGHLSLAKLTWVDTKALSPANIKVLSRHSTKLTEDQLKEYRNNLVRGGNLLVDLEENLQVMLKVPTVAEWEESGTRWVMDMERMVVDAFGESLETAARNQAIQQYSRATALRQYSHWVDHFIIAGVATDSESDTIDRVLSGMTADQSLHDKFLAAVGKYIDSTAVSVVAIPSYECPKCKTMQEDPEGFHPRLIPLDVTRIFFTLLHQRVMSTLKGVTM